jgi:hypothetical protein
MDAKKIEAIVNRNIPCNVKDVLSFLGGANYNRIFIKNFAAIAKPLYCLLTKDKKFT